MIARAHNLLNHLTQVSMPRNAGGTLVTQTRNLHLRQRHPAAAVRR
jgi:hypothetical protein